MERFSNNESNRNNKENINAVLRSLRRRKAKGKKSVTFRNNLKTFHNIPMNNLNITRRKAHKKSKLNNDFNTLTDEEKTIVRNAFFDKTLTHEQIINRMQIYVDYLAGVRNYNKNRTYLTDEELEYLYNYL